MDGSLQRLKTDHVDLYQCHRYDPNTPLEETMQALSEVVRAGQGALYRLQRMVAAADRSGVAVPGHGEFRLQPAAIFAPVAQAGGESDSALHKNGVSQIVWSPLAQGVLTGKYDPNSPPPADTRAASEKMGGMMQRVMVKEVLEAVQKLKPIAKEAGLTLTQFSLAWILREPNVASAIVGASRPEQLDENAKASGADVDPALFARAEQILAEALPAQGA
jgi:1-deoxyxylulose-5-phosphate synthase